MIKTYTPYLLLIVWFSYISYFLIFPFYLTGNYNKISEIIKQTFQSLIESQLKYSFNPKIHYNDLIYPTKDKIDIVMANHFSTIDWELILSMFNKSNIHNYIIVGKKELNYFPGFGLHFMIDKHIKLVRNWEQDKESLFKQIDKINNGVIFIFPEGTRYDEDKFKKAQDFSLNNNLPIYTNLLVPKSKGLWSIYNQLKEKNKLGKIIDMTMILKNYKNKNVYLSDLNNDIGDVYIINRELEYPSNYINNEDFKKYLLNEWKNKDIIMNNYNKINYNILELKNNLFDLYIAFLLIALITFGLYYKKEIRYYLLCVMILSYTMVFFSKI